MQGSVTLPDHNTDKEDGDCEYDFTDFYRVMLYAERGITTTSCLFVYQPVGDVEVS